MGTVLDIKNVVILISLPMISTICEHRRGKLCGHPQEESAPNYIPNGGIG